MAHSVDAEVLDGKVLDRRDVSVLDHAHSGRRSGKLLHQGVLHEVLLYEGMVDGLRCGRTDEEKMVEKAGAKACRFGAEG